MEDLIDFFMNDNSISHMGDGRGGLGRLTGSDAGSRKALAEFYGRLFKEFHLTQPQSDCFVLAFDALKHEKLRKECVVNVNKTKAQANAQVLGSSPSFMEPPVSAGRTDDASARNHRALAQTGGSNEPVQPAGRAGVRKVSMGSDPSGSAQQSAMPAAARVPAEAVPMPGQSKVRKVRQTDSDAPAALSHAESALADGSDRGQQPVDSTTEPPSAQSPCSPAQQQPLGLSRAAAATTDPPPSRPPTQALSAAKTSQKLPPTAQSHAALASSGAAQQPAAAAQHLPSAAPAGTHPPAVADLGFRVLGF